MLEIIVSWLESRHKCFSFLYISIQALILCGLWKKMVSATAKRSNEYFGSNLSCGNIHRYLYIHIYHQGGRVWLPWAHYLWFLLVWVANSCMHCNAVIMNTFCTYLCGFVFYTAAVMKTCASFKRYITPHLLSEWIKNYITEWSLSAAFISRPNNHFIIPNPFRPSSGIG